MLILSSFLNIPKHSILVYLGLSPRQNTFLKTKVVLRQEVTLTTRRILWFQVKLSYAVRATFRTELATGGFKHISDKQPEKCSYLIAKPPFNCMFTSFGNYSCNRKMGAGTFLGSINCALKRKKLHSASWCT